jgi:hypothetical protein
MRILALILALTCVACGNKRTKALPDVYFNVQQYFEQEGLRLDKAGVSVLKTVSRNSTRETRRVKVNWTDELRLFAESDINKPAWRNSYKKMVSPGKIEYLATDDKLRTRRIEILQKDMRPIALHIVNRTSNFLYTSTEDLVYYPDSSYQIQKIQNVRFLGTNNYRVTGNLR